MSATSIGFIVGAVIAIVAGVVLSGFGGASVATVVPFAALLFGCVGALIGWVVSRCLRYMNAMFTP